MKIKEVEEIVGITKKNIRFYEDQGLLQIDRKENGYREYHEKDIQRLKEIKLYRLVDIPIDTIKDIFDGKKDARTCIEKQINHFNKEKQNIEKLQQVCRLISSKETINVDEELQYIQTLEKEGIQFIDIHKDTKKTRKKDAIISTSILSLILIGFMLLFYYLNIIDPIPIGIFLFLESIVLFVLIVILLTLKTRIKEIERGELEEAKRY